MGRTRINSGDVISTGGVTSDQGSMVMGREAAQKQSGDVSELQGDAQAG
jgi:hypothetical protein